MDRLFKVWPQYILPHHLLSRGMHFLTRLHGGALSHAAIRFIVKRFRVDLEEAERSNVRDFVSFNDFFTRSLKPGARPIDKAPEAVISPVDGTVSQVGQIREGRIFQAKGHDYSAAELLGDKALAEDFDDGEFATIYLSPRDYHRIHMPCDGSLLRMIHVPGRLFSVNPLTTRTVPGLFARNERVVTIFDTPFGRVAQVMVGAIFVSSIETVWAGEVTPPAGQYIRSWNYGPREAAGEVHLKKGDEMGRFNMGSTVILLFEPRAVKLAESFFEAQAVKLGQRIATRGSTRS
ncbi:MAG: archaetidylserine decarboxylase [Gammaproteobacteria bacterium]|nr:archaetidylserine decarboxylase [Gammaproteobacteria bacterium]